VLLSSSANVLERENMENRKTDGEQWRTQEFCSGEFNKFSRGQRTAERGTAGGSPLFRGSGGSFHFVQEISFHIVKVS